MCPAVIVWDADGIAVVKVIQNQNLGAEIQNVYTFRYLVLIPVSAFFQFFILEHSKNRLEDVQSQYPTAARFPLLSIGHWQTRTPEPRTSLLGQSQRTGPVSNPVPEDVNFTASEKAFLGPSGPGTTEEYHKALKFRK